MSSLPIQSNLSNMSSLEQNFSTTVNLTSYCQISHNGKYSHGCYNKFISSNQILHHDFLALPFQHQFDHKQYLY
ncbi:hypothetical protein THF1C08_50335 [Vibrio jasicida]|uniref:Uncharacterized protein n=1 Tax=Vibrio jasicida TaxID=766224 RepID=A0AAU9QVF1_9VIBR|nr:hypothetical protein THF1C08_50335 [Vibrio jasicida]CAH1601376.1 hypothetical protein THF1A12_50011 [Vibrio jasicida]